METKKIKEQSEYQSLHSVLQLHICSNCSFPCFCSLAIGNPTFFAVLDCALFYLHDQPKKTQLSQLSLLYCQV